MMGGILRWLLGPLMAGLALLVSAPPTAAQTPNLAETVRQSIVYIYFDVTDPETGGKATSQGTGFVISPNGYVLTASHLFTDWLKQRDVDKESNPIRGTLRDKPGFVPDQPLNLQIIKLSDPALEDVALLKFPDPGPNGYPTAPICFSEASSLRTGEEIFAFGFPLDQNFQPVRGTLGTQNAPGARWAAASPFAHGMSGGPVYNARGFVMGLVKGGSETTDAVKWITPIGFAKPLLLSPFIERCVADPELAKAPPAKQYCADIRHVLDSAPRRFDDILGRKRGESRTARIPLTGWEDCLVFMENVFTDNRRYSCSLSGFGDAASAVHMSEQIATALKNDCLGSEFSIGRSFDTERRAQMIVVGQKTDATITIRAQKERTSIYWDVILDVEY